MDIFCARQANSLAPFQTEISLVPGTRVLVVNKFFQTGGLSQSLHFQYRSYPVFSKEVTVLAAPLLKSGIRPVTRLQDALDS
eukprot:SAG11_NODE_703_length_7658_cov_12.066411_1_plen_82_part_00